MIARVTDTASFQAFRKPAARVSAGSLWVSYLDDGYDPPRVAFAVGRSFGIAVRRNLFRRRSREILRRLSPPLAPGSYLIGARPAADSMSFAECSAAMDRLFSSLTKRLSS